ncbi:acetyl-CoA C-acyltransferase, partial [Rhodothermus marinus]|uniref:acetyl-CoA C-acyltransferase n=1 Tax=Rhodothermus marinus TaxID=29549 RepID=UPI001FB253FD
VHGCANQAGEDNRNVARMALLLADLPPSVPGVTINRLCASGMSAVVEAARAIRAGDGDLYLAGGIEHMTRAPFVLSKASRPFGRDVELYDTSLGWRFVNPKMEARYGAEPMGCTAENLVERYGIAREDQDLFAYRSHKKAAAAREQGASRWRSYPSKRPSKGPARPVKDDEHIRPDTTLEALAKLPPVFRKGGTVTAGNSSGLNDGACALLLASEEAVRRFNLKPKARIVSSAVVGVEPRIMASVRSRR